LQKSQSRLHDKTILIRPCRRGCGAPLIKPREGRFNPQRPDSGAKYPPAADSHKLRDSAKLL
jgi:hypothetical protein